MQVRSISPVCFTNDFEKYMNREEFQYSSMDEKLLTIYDMLVETNENQKKYATQITNNQNNMHNANKLGFSVVYDAIPGFGGDSSYIEKKFNSTNINVIA